MLASASEEPSCPVTLLYIHSEHETPALDGRIATVVDRYAPMVELVSVTADEVGERYPQIAGFAPAVLVLRHGQVVGEAMGDCLPQHELDTVVRCAVKWPDAA